MPSPSPTIDLAAYAARLALPSLPPPTPAGVGALIHAHATHIPFENLDAFLGRGVALAVDAVERKLVGQRRGGWCFEQNLLLGEALRALGVDAVDVAARVRWFRPPGLRTARTHRALLLTLEGRRWLADVGFGVLTPTALLELVPDREQPTPHETYRFVHDGGYAHWQLEARLAGAWQPVYAFDLERWWPEDFNAVNFQLAHDPGSPFVATLQVARPVDGGRLTLRDAELTRRGLDGGAQTRRLRSLPELFDVLADGFGIDARAVPDAAERLARVFVPAS